jgi:hypothetical protein
MLQLVVMAAYGLTPVSVAARSAVGMLKLAIINAIGKVLERMEFRTTVEFRQGSQIQRKVECSPFRLLTAGT